MTFHLHSETHSLTHIHILQGKRWHFILAWGETQSREQGKIRTLAACFFLSICVCVCVCVCVAAVDTLAASSSACFVFSLLAPVLKQYFPAAHFSTLVSNATHKPSRAACKHRRVHSPQCLAWIFIIVCCFACSHLWPYILINGSQMSFTKIGRASCRERV